MQYRIQNKCSFYTFLILSATLVFGRFLLPRFEDQGVLAILSWDVFGYYLYLPAKFIHHDLGIKDFTWVQQILDTYNPTIGFYQAYQGPAGDYVMKYTMGLAILNAPFFFIGHFFAWILGFPKDGFSMPYQVSIAIGALVYAVIGISVLRKVLLRFFSDQMSAMIMILIVLGTNFYQLTAYDGAMPHNYLFAIYALIVWLTIRWHKEPGWRNSIFLGLLIGLSILIRPTSGVIILVPIFWGIYDKDSFKEKWRLVKIYRKLVLTMFVMILVFPCFQMLYWLIHAGNFFYYSYESNEKLEWIAPYLVQVLFSYKKGWLVYTPLMVFSIIGFYHLAARKKELYYPVFLFFIINLFLIASWPTWWYGGSLGQRTMMESYVLMALPLGFFLQWVASKKISIKIPFILIFIFFILLNLFQTWQYMNFIIEPSNMTGKYYWAIFGKIKAPEPAKIFIEGWTKDAPESLIDTTGYTKKTLGYWDFETQGNFLPGHLDKWIHHTGNFGLRMDSTLQYAPGFNVKFSGITSKAYCWLRVSGWVFSAVPFEKNPGNLVVTVNHKGTLYKYKTFLFETAKFQVRKWNRFSMDYMTPYVPDPDDELQVYVWYHGKHNLWMDDFRIDQYEPAE